MDCGPFFLCLRAVGMDLHDCTVEGQRLYPDPDDLLVLECSEHSIQHAGIGPAVHPGIDGVPATKSLRQASPLTPMLRHV